MYMFVLMACVVVHSLSNDSLQLLVDRFNCVRK